MCNETIWWAALTANQKFLFIAGVICLAFAILRAGIIYGRQP
jgi:hypothetical protein